MLNDSRVTDGLRVGAYYRMSSDEQSLSLPQQQKEVRRLCESNGWVIVDTYPDEGKSGSKEISKRTAFHRMIEDAKAGKFQAIVCYDTSRFGRLDSQTGAPYKLALRQAGVWLETVKDGRIDWTTSMGRLTDALLSEKNHEYAVNLSHAAIRGRIDVAEQGYWAHGHIPYGYDREYVEGSQTIGVYPRTKVVSKARNWHTKLRINDVEAAVVGEIFGRLADEDVSVRRLAVELNKKGVPSPGKTWMPQQIRHIIRERAYIGQVSFGFGRKTREAHNRVETRIVEGACPAIVDRAVWERANAKVAERKLKRAGTSEARSGALSGVLVCGHCGKPMHLRRRGVKNVQYICSSGSMRGHVGCKWFSIQESRAVDLICERLFDAIDAALIERLKIDPPKRVKSDLDALRDAVGKLERQYERARDNLLKADPSLYADLQADAMRMRGELDKTRNTLAVAESEGGKDQLAFVQKWWDEQKAKANIITVKKGDYRVEYEGGKGVMKFNLRPERLRLKFLACADRGEVKIADDGMAILPKRFTRSVETTPDQLRALLKTLNARLVLHWDVKGNRWYVLKTGELTADVLPTPKVVDPSTISRWRRPGTGRAVR